MDLFALLMAITGGILSLIVYYLIIKWAAKSAVKEANADIVSLLVTQNRMLAKLLAEKGVQREDIEKVYTSSQEEFWSDLGNRRDPQTGTEI